MSQPCKFSRRDMLRAIGASIALPVLSTLRPSLSRAAPSEATCFADATGLAQRIRNKEISPVELMRMHLDRVEAINPKLNAIVTLADGCLERSRRAEKAVMRGELLGPLHSVPFTIKDVFDTRGVRTTRGSRIFKDRVPAKDATLVQRLKRRAAFSWEKPIFRNLPYRLKQRTSFLDGRSIPGIRTEPVADRLVARRPPLLQVCHHWG